MPTVLITYGLNPVTGLKFMVQPDGDQPSPWSQIRQRLVPTIKQWLQHPPPMQVSLGTLVPDETEQGSPLQRLTRYKFFIAVETEGAKRALLPPAAASGRKTGIQVYRHCQGEENYKAQVVRFHLGSRRRSRPRVN